LLIKIYQFQNQRDHWSNCEVVSNKHILSKLSCNDFEYLHVSIHFDTEKTIENLNANFKQYWKPLPHIAIGEITSLSKEISLSTTYQRQFPCNWNQDLFVSWWSWIHLWFLKQCEQTIDNEEICHWNCEKVTKKTISCLCWLLLWFGGFSFCSAKKGI
jgi:hypothetical protein